MDFFTIFLAILVLNGLAFAVYAHDKKLAQQRRRRASESDLHWLALVGGSIGAITACYMLRHKTRKMSFLRLLWIIAILQFILIFCLAAIGPAQMLALVHQSPI